MRQRPARRLLKVLRATVDQLGRNTDLAPDDLVLTRLKRALLRRIADLEIADASLVSVVDTAAVLYDGGAPVPVKVAHEAEATEPRQPPDQAA